MATKAELESLGARLESCAGTDRVAASEIRGAAEHLGRKRKAEKAWLGRIADRLDANADLLSTYIGDENIDDEEVKQAAKFNRRVLLRAGATIGALLVGGASLSNDVTDLAEKMNRANEYVDVATGQADALCLAIEEVVPDPKAAARREIELLEQRIRSVTTHLSQLQDPRHENAMPFSDDELRERISDLSAQTRADSIALSGAAHDYYQAFGPDRFYEEHALEEHLTEPDEDISRGR